MPEAVDEKAVDGVPVLELDGGLALDKAVLVTDAFQRVLLPLQQPLKVTKMSFSGTKFVLYEKLNFEWTTLVL